MIWRMIDDLKVGTEAMRAAGPLWLPMEPRETPEGYAIRIQRSFLFGGFKDTIIRIVSKPFSRPVTIRGSELPEKCFTIIDNADEEGTDLSPFARDCFEELVSRGRVNILVDHTFVQEGATKADAPNDRAYFVRVTQPSLLGVKRVNGKLTEVRIAEEAVVSDGEWGEALEKRVLVYRSTEWIRYRVDADADVEIARGVNRLGEVPLVEVIADECPPLLDLAWMNCAHWQSYSDQRYILRVARCAILVAVGFDEGDMEGFAIGPTQMLETTNPSAKLTYTEHSGQAIGAGRDDLKDLEDRMETLGLQPLVRWSSNSTAAGKTIDEGRQSTEVQAWIALLEKGLDQAFALAAKWNGETLGEDTRVEIHKNFSASTTGTTEAETLLKYRMAGEIDRSTLYAELQRRGFLDDAVDVEAVTANLEQEGPNGLDESEDVRSKLDSRTLPSARR